MTDHRGRRIAPVGRVGIVSTSSLASLVSVFVLSGPGLVHEGVDVVAHDVLAQENVPA